MADFDKVILPGKEGTIGITITGFKIHPGRFTKSFTVTTNDPDQQKVILTVTGIVKKVFDFSLQSISLSGFISEMLKGETIISNKLAEPVNITGWEWSDKSRNYDFLCDNIGVKIETIEAGRQYRVKTWTKEPAVAGAVSGELILKTSFKDMPEKSLSFNMVITPDVQVHPSSIIMREMVIKEGTSQNFEKSISIIAARGDTLKILKVIPDRPDITANIREVKAGQAFSCKISIRPPSETGKYVGNITFITNYKGYEKLTAEIRGTIRVTK